jgi:CubicO group peptidase (beta-lactamase class C family)
MRDLQSHDSSSGDQLTAARASGLGLDPGAVVDLIDDIEAAGLDPHSLMVLRGGRVAVAGWWHPYGPQTRQLVYSLSKSFTATAVGIAIGEGRFGLDDPISTVLGSAPGPLAEGAQRILVRHLLAMASGHGSDTITAMLSTGDALACAGRAGLESDSQQVVAAVLAEPLAAEPGELFTYNQGCSYLLSAAIRHTTGLQLSEYLRPRLFDPLGIGPVHWRRFCGLEQGFSGLHVRTSDIAALGQLYLQQGRWAGRRLVPAGFVAEASAVHVPTAQRQSDPDWQQGYGFHFWQCRFGAFRGDGAFGQFCIVIPDADLVVVTTAQTVRMPDLAEAIWRHLLPGLDRARYGCPRRRSQGSRVRIWRAVAVSRWSGGRGGCRPSGFTSRRRVKAGGSPSTICRRSWCGPTPGRRGSWRSGVACCRRCGCAGGGVTRPPSTWMSSSSTHRTG